VCLPLSGSGTAERLLPWRAAPNVRLSASLEAQRFAARYFQRRVRAVSDRRVALAAARRGWQLLQFDVAPAWAGRRWWRHGRGQLARPVWRPALAAVAVVLAVNVLGLNLLAWRTRANLDDQRLAMAQLLREAHPGVRAVLDAPRQMAQETERLRAVRDVRRSAELPGLLRGVASAWPAGVPAPGGWHYLNDRLLLEESALTVAQAEVLRAGLRPGGWAIERRDGQWHVHRDVAVRAVPTRASGGPGDRPEGRP
jgi:general secretion pathway protein L